MKVWRFCSAEDATIEKISTRESKHPKVFIRGEF